jgi:hypothetical protein
MNAPTPASPIATLIQKAQPRILTAGFCMGVCLLAASLWQTLHFLQGAVSAPGKIIRLQEVAPEADDETRTKTYRAVFQFTAADGKDHTLTSQLNAYPAIHQVGEAVTVLYPAAHPEAAKIKNYWELWFHTTIFSVITAIFLVWRIVLARHQSAAASTGPR